MASEWRSHPVIDGSLPCQWLHKCIRKEETFSRLMNTCWTLCSGLIMSECKYPLLLVGEMHSSHFANKVVAAINLAFHWQLTLPRSSLHLDPRRTLVRSIVQYKPLYPNLSSVLPLTSHLANSDPSEHDSEGLLCNLHRVITYLGKHLQHPRPRCQLASCIKSQLWMPGNLV
jgi:hypothetical protein